METSETGLARRVLGGTLAVLLGVVRLGVVVAAYLGGVLGGGLAGLAVGLGTNLGTAALYAAVGGLVMPLAITAGFVLWLMPASLRVQAAGKDPELEFLVPRRIDGLLFVGSSAGLAALVGGFFSAYLGLALVVPAVLAAGLIAVSGGRRVAEIWLGILMLAAE